MLKIISMILNFNVFGFYLPVTRVWRILPAKPRNDGLGSQATWPVDRSYHSAVLLKGISYLVYLFNNLADTMFC